MSQLCTAKSDGDQQSVFHHAPARPVRLQPGNQSNCGMLPGVRNPCKLLATDAMHASAPQHHFATPLAELQFRLIMNVNAQLRSLARLLPDVVGVSL